MPLRNLAFHPMKQSDTMKKQPASAHTIRVVPHDLSWTHEYVYSPEGTPSVRESKDQVSDCGNQGQTQPSAAPP